MDCKEWQYEILKEYAFASGKFGSFASAHEGIAVLREEYLELEREVFKKNPDDKLLEKEAIQVAAMALRFLIDVCNKASLEGK